MEAIAAFGTSLDEGESAIDAGYRVYVHATGLHHAVH
jgi:hypothetical protein